MQKGLQGRTHLCEKLSYERYFTDSITAYDRCFSLLFIFNIWEVSKLPLSFGLTIRLVLVEAVPVIVTSVGDSIPSPLNEKRPFFRPLKSSLVVPISLMGRRSDLRVGFLRNARK